MRRGRVYNHGQFAGVIEEFDDRTYRFAYDEAYVADDSAHAISLTLPKRVEPFESEHLFSFFYGLLAEGTTRQLQARILGIDEEDDFGLLLATAKDTVGSVTIEAVQT